MVKKDNITKTIKTFLYAPFQVGENHKILCQCGKLMRVKGVASSGYIGDVEAICECGNKLLFIWEFVKEFPHIYDKVEIKITKHKEVSSVSSQH